MILSLRDCCRKRIRSNQVGRPMLLRRRSSSTRHGIITVGQRKNSYVRRPFTWSRPSRLEMAGTLPRSPGPQRYWSSNVRDRAFKGIEDDGLQLLIFVYFRVFYRRHWSSGSPSKSIQKDEKGMFFCDDDTYMHYSGLNIDLQKSPTSE